MIWRSACGPRGLNAAVDYGFDRGLHIPMVVGLPDKPFALAVLTETRSS